MNEQPCPFEALGRHAHVTNNTLYFPDTLELRGIMRTSPPLTILVASNIQTQSGLSHLLWAIEKGLIFLS